jgi:hypothetical protein
MKSCCLMFWVFLFLNNIIFVRITFGMISCSLTMIVFKFLILMKGLLWTIYFLFFGIPGGWTQGLTLDRQALYHLSHIHNYVSYFWGRGLLYAQLAWTTILPFVFSVCREARNTGMCYFTQPLVEMWYHLFSWAGLEPWCSYSQPLK